MKRKMAIVVGLVVAAVAVWLFWRGEEKVSGSVEADKHSSVGKKKPPLKKLSRRSDGADTKARREIDAAVDKIRSGGRRSEFHVGGRENDESSWVDEDGNPWPEAQRALMREIVGAAEAEDFAALAALAQKVAQSENAELREQYVEELGWFGAQALGELVPFLADVNEDVAETARSQVTDAFQDVDTDAEKAAVFTLLSRAVVDTEVLEDISGELESLDEVIALQAIVDTIGEGTPEAQEAAKAAYKEITDADWTDIDAAEKWLEENYVSDDDNDDGDDDSSNESKETDNAEADGEGAVSKDGEE